METYLPFCEQYAAMAQCFYSQYQQSAAGNDVIDSIAMEQSAICAVIFQALAVESYVNLFGSVILGNISSSFLDSSSILFVHFG